MSRRTRQRLRDRAGVRLPIYRSRHGTVLGVCKGIADHFDLPVFWVRVIVILLAVFTTFWPVIIGYLLAAMLMKPEPVVPLSSDSEHEFYDSYTTSRALALRRLKDQFDRLDRRIGRMEDVVTSREYTWKRQMR